jgi:metal-responsive CopG/Arc/MetJ family transcriptional regulator
VHTLNGVPSSKPFVHLVLDDELLQRIDDFRFGFRLPSRSAAIRWLIVAALDQNPIPEPDWEKYGTRPNTGGGPVKFEP